MLIAGRMVTLEDIAIVAGMIILAFGAMTLAFEVKSKAINFMMAIPSVVAICYVSATITLEEVILLWPYNLGQMAMAAILLGVAAGSASKAFANLSHRHYHGA